MLAASPRDSALLSDLGEVSCGIFGLISLAMNAPHCDPARAEREPSLRGLG